MNLVNAVPMGSHLVEWVVHFIRETRPEQSRFKEVQELVEWGAGVRFPEHRSCREGKGGSGGKFRGPP